MELALWRWSTAVQVTSLVMVTLFFAVLARSVRLLELRFWVQAWGCNLLALLVTLIFWYLQLGERFFPFARAAYVTPKTLFVLLLIQGAWALKRPGSRLLRPPAVLVALAAYALAVMLMPNSLDLLGAVQHSLITLLVAAGVVLLARPQVEAGLGWLVAGLVVRALLSAMEAAAYASRLAPAWFGQELTSQAGLFLAASSSFDSGAEWLLALGCVLALSERAQRELRRSNADLEQALEATGDAVQRAETLRAASEALSQSLELEQVLGLILSELRKVVDYDSASVQELEERGLLRIIAGVGFPNLDAVVGLTFDGLDKRSPNGQVVQSQAPCIVADTANFPNFGSGIHAARGTRSWLGVPLQRGNRLIGLITLDKREPGFYTEEHARLATTFGHQAAISIENARLLAREKAAHEQAKQASRAKSAFVASMSHELRTPLNAVLGFAQLMARRPGRDAEDREHLAAIGRGGEHLLRLINDVLSLAKIEAGQLTENLEDFDPAALLRSVSELFRPRAASKGLAFVLEAQAGFPRSVRGDQGKLRQILINLIGNAVKFTQSGKVALRASWHTGGAAFEVEDTGPGLSPEEISGLFAAFAQAEAGRRLQDGTGLGLALSRSYARFMGGDVTVRSSVGKGSVFRLKVPLPESAAAADPSHVREGRVRGLATGQRRFAILVVDDDPQNRTILSQLLGSVGFDVASAANGADGLASWRERRPDLVIMDINMPGLDGLQTTQLLRTEERERGLARTPVLAVSASAFEHEREGVLAAGCDGFVAKPYREEDLFELIAKQLGIRYVRDVTQAELASGPIEVTREQVLGLPAEWRARFREALESSDNALAESLVREIERRDAPLARELLARVKSYRLGELEQLLGD